MNEFNSSNPANADALIRARASEQAQAEAVERFELVRVRNELGEVQQQADGTWWAFAKRCLTWTISSAGVGLALGAFIGWSIAEGQKPARKGGRNAR